MYYFDVSSGILGKNPSVSLQESTFDLPISFSDALPLSCRRPVGATVQFISVKALDTFPNYSPPPFTMLYFNSLSKQDKCREGPTSFNIVWGEEGVCGLSYQ